MTRRASISLLSILFLTLPLLGQTAYKSKTYQAQRPSPSGALNITPNPGIQGQVMTVNVTLNNPPLYISGSAPPPPKYGFVIRKPDNTEVYKRDLSTSSTGTWTPVTPGSYYVIGAVQLYNKDGSAQPLLNAGPKNFTVNSPGLTWAGPINASTLGSQPASHLDGKSIKDIVNSVKSGRADTRKCNECHGLNMSKMYKPDTQQPITPSTTITRGDAYNNVYRWNQSGSTGVIEKFCATSGKPSDLCTVFRKWASDGYKQ